VIAGGGVSAIAWELRVLRGVADADAELAHKIIRLRSALIFEAAGTSPDDDAGVQHDARSE
jgi:hypothetical protein